jgi:hypothetical protein
VPYDDEHYVYDRFSLAHIDIAAPYQFDDVASLSSDPDILIGMIAELRDENDKLRTMLETLERTLFGSCSEKFDADAGQLPLELRNVSLRFMRRTSMRSASRRLQSIQSRRVCLDGVVRGFQNGGPATICVSTSA